MPTGTTGQLGLALPVQGELSGTWGNTVNNAITEYTNIAIAATLTLTGDGAVTLANTTGTDLATNITSTLTGAGTVTAQFAIVRVTGTLTTAKVVTAPSYSKTYTVVNAATGGIVTFKASGQTGVSIAVGESAFVYFNGTDYVKLAGTATAGAAAGSNTQVQYNSSGSLAGSANLTFSGTVLGVASGIFKANGAPSLSAATAGEAILAPEPSLGALLYGQGTTYDVVLGSRGTNVALGVLANSTNVYAAGNVGIGTASPANVLNVKSGTQYKGVQVNNATNTIAELIGFNASNEAGGLKLYNAASPIVQILSDGTSFLNGGNLGVGTTSPSTLLDLVRSSTSGSDATMPNLFVRNTSGTQGNGSSTFNQAVAIVSAGNGTVVGGIRAAYDSAGPYGTGMQLYVSGGSNALQFFTNSAERVRIDSAGTFIIKNDYQEQTFTANSSTAITLNIVTNGTDQVITLTGTATITMPTATAGKSFLLKLKTGAGGYTVTWSTVSWPGGTAPTLTSAASKMDIFSFFSDGTNWYGTTVGQNYTP